MIRAFQIHPAATADDVGLIPSFLDEHDPRPAAQQFHERYVSGWHPQPRFELHQDCGLKYPGDPVMRPLAGMRLRDELILVYRSGYVAIIQRDRSFEVCRMD